jgi:hypothetical protein
MFEDRENTDCSKAALQRDTTAEGSGLPWIRSPCCGVGKRSVADSGRGSTARQEPLILERNWYYNMPLSSIASHVPYSVTPTHWRSQISKLEKGAD